MTNSMSRWVLAGALALGALAAVGGLMPMAAEAKAANGGNPFAGAYGGLVPGVPIVVSHSVDIDQHGGITALNGGIQAGGGGTQVGFTGKVNVKGRMTCSGSWAAWFVGSGDFSFTADVVKDASGNLLGTTTTGETFVWYRSN